MAAIAGFTVYVMVTETNVIHICLFCRIKFCLVLSNVSFLITGVVYGFNIQCSEAVQKLARSKGVSVRFHNIIYKLMDDVREELTSRLPPRVVEEVVGQCRLSPTHKEIFSGDLTG